jgi:hypothetical protein
MTNWLSQIISVIEQGGIELTVTTCTAVLWVTTLCGSADSYQRIDSILGVDAVWSMYTKDSEKNSDCGGIISG